MTAMRGVCAFAAVSMVIVLSACTSDAESATPQTEVTTAPTTGATTTPSAEPSPEATYVPEPGDPKKKSLDVTIIDEARWVYDPATGCGDGSDFGPAFVAVSGPTREYDWAPRGDDVVLDSSATLTTDENCTTTVSMTVPFAPRYRVGVGFEGKGISDGTEPHQFVRIDGSDQPDAQFTTSRDDEVQHVTLVIGPR